MRPGMESKSRNARQTSLLPEVNKGLMSDSEGGWTAANNTNAPKLGTTGMFLLVKILCILAATALLSS